MQDERLKIDYSRRVNTIVTCAIGGLLLEQFTKTAEDNRRVLEAYPEALTWIGFSTFVGTSLLYLNGRKIGLRGPVLNCLGYGAAGTLFGFAVQRMVNTRLNAALGTAAVGTLGSLLLGFGAGVCQTLGKTLAALKFRQVFAEDRREGMAVGLSIGLGFGLAELIVLAMAAMPKAAYISPLWAVERCSAVGFHIYSGGLISLAFIEKQYPLIGLVVALHTLIDGLGRPLGQVNLLLAEAYFAVLASITWYIWRRRSKITAERVDALPPADLPALT